jgi:hypothetical protein
MWDTISDSDKAIILGIGTSPLRRVHFHDIAGTGFEDDATADSTNLTLVNTNSLVSSSGTTDPGSTVLPHASTTTKRTWTKPQGSDLAPSDIRKVLSSVKPHEPGSTEHQDITIHGKTYRLVDVVSTYQISAAVHHSKHASLVDRGAKMSILLLLMIRFSLSLMLLIPLTITLTTTPFIVSVVLTCLFIMVP